MVSFYIAWAATAATHPIMIGDALVQPKAGQPLTPAERAAAERIALEEAAAEEIPEPPPGDETINRPADEL